jgi:hypothetical protein
VINQGINQGIYQKIEILSFNHALEFFFCIYLCQRIYPGSSYGIEMNEVSLCENVMY